MTVGENRSRAHRPGRQGAGRLGEPGVRDSVRQEANKPAELLHDVCLVLIVTPVVCSALTLFFSHMSSFNPEEVVLYFSPLYRCGKQDPKSYIWKVAIRGCHQGCLVPESMALTIAVSLPQGNFFIKQIKNSK